MNASIDTVAVMFQREPAPVLLAHFRHFFEGHFEESKHYHDTHLLLDEDAYLRADMRGFLRVYTVRSAEGRPAGYAVFILASGLKQRASLCAHHDSLYVAPRYRSARLLRDFLNYCDAEMKGEGVAVVHQIVNASLDYGALLISMGYELQSHTYARRLNG